MSGRLLGRGRISTLLADAGPRRPLHLVAWLALSGYTLFVLWLSVPVLVAFYDVPIGFAFAFASLQCLTLPLAVRRPRIALGLHLAGILLVAFSTRLQEDDLWPMTIPGLLALVGLLVVIGLRETWVVAVVAWWSAFLALVLSVVLWVGPVREQSDWGFDLLAAVSATLIALSISVGVAQRRRVRAALAAAQRDVELEQAKRHTVEERARIARELHDVVAHSMSIVHIQAESARYRVTDAEEAQREFADIARSARSALREMRQLLGALRPDDEVEYAPQPSIVDISSLIATTEKVGNRIILTGDLAAIAASPLTELTVYRIVQEALSNIVRHAPKADVLIAITRTDESITVRVANAPSLAIAPGTGMSLDSGGQGLRGMRERVDLLGGTVVQEPLPDGGFLIEAALPLTDPQETT